MELSTEIVKQLNDRILSQSIIIQTLCDMLIENKIISEDDLEIRLKKGVEILESELGTYNKEIEKTEEFDLDLVHYFGPIGKA